MFIHHSCMYTISTVFRCCMSGNSLLYNLFLLCLVFSDLLVLDTPEKVQAYRSALAARKGAAVATPTSSTSSAGQPDADVVMTTPIGQMQPAATEDLLMNTPRPVSHKVHIGTRCR